MASSKTMLAIGLAAATLVVFVVVIAMGGALRAGLAPWPGIGIGVLAIAAFTVSRERRSFVVAGLLAASGLVGVVYALIRTDFLMASSFPGPIFGLILGLPILVLAVAEAVGANRPRALFTPPLSGDMPAGSHAREDRLNEEPLQTGERPQAIDEPFLQTLPMELHVPVPSSGCRPKVRR